MLTSMYVVQSVLLAVRGTRGGVLLTTGRSRAKYGELGLALSPIPWFGSSTIKQQNYGTLIRSKVNELYCAKCPENGYHTSGFEGPVGLRVGFSKGGAREKRSRTQELTMRRRPEPFRALIVALGLNPLQGFVGPVLLEAPCGSSKRAGARSPVASRWVALGTRWPKVEPRMSRVESVSGKVRARLKIGCARKSTTHVCCFV